MPATATPRKVNRKPVITRTAHVEFLRDGLWSLDLTIVTNGKGQTFNYYVEDLGSDADDLGDRTILRQCYRVHKTRVEAANDPTEPDNYDCKIDTNPIDPERPVHSCECRGFLAWNRCKHTASLAALIRAGKI